MVEHALAAEGAAVKVLRPVLLRAEHADLHAEEFVDELRRMAAAIVAGRGAAGRPAQAAFRAAYEAALASQRRFEEGLRAIGSRALAWARDEGRPVVLVAGETHVLHEPVINSGIQELVAANGAVPLPADCYPLPKGVPPLARLHWASAGSALRAVVAATEAGGVYPLLLCAYGCGPNSFVEHLFDHLLEDYPHTVLESDGHGGKAGYVTRVQAFLHTVRAYEAERAGGRGPPAPSTPGGWPATTRRCRAAWTARATAASTSVTSAAAWAGSSPPPCAAAGSTPTTPDRRTSWRWRKRAVTARARNACRISSSGAAWRASCRRSRAGPATERPTAPARPCS